MFFIFLLQTLFLEAAPIISSASRNYAYAGWGIKKRTLVLDIAAAASIQDLSKVVTQITGAEATLTPDQFKSLQDQMSKAVANAENEDAAKKAVAKIIVTIPQSTEKQVAIASVPLQAVQIPKPVLEALPAQGSKDVMQSFHRPSIFQLVKIAIQLYKEGKLKPEPQRSDYQSYDLYEAALKNWSQGVLRQFLAARHPFLLSEVRAKWKIRNQAEIPETAEILQKIIDSENHTSADHIPYYHGMNSMATFLMVMYDVFFQVFQEHGLKPNFSKLRMSSDKKTFDQIFKSPEFSSFIMQHLEKTRLAANLLPKETEKLKYFDNNSAVTAHFISAAPSILADATTESPLFFFVNQVAIVLSESLLNLIIGNALRVVGVPESQVAEQAQRYIALAKEFAPQIKRAIAQIFIHDAIVNDVSYIAARGGLPFNFNPQDNNFFTDTRGFLRYFGAGGYESLEGYIKDHPELAYTELGQQFSAFQSGRTYWEHGLQVRILATSPLLEESNNLLVKIFVYKAAEEPLDQMRQRLKQLAAEDLVLSKR